eukprot:Phypoly_transcript_12532.p1 GENE.Phypoly_transcript_12532~~Phypoly_transcript_12532.p1  ORF type:complete len:324 (+),score=5.27 Phypoly_transcript_12532:138-1109(+)
MIKPLSVNSLHLLSRVSCITAALGLVGSIFIIATYVLFKDSRNFGTRLVFCLSIADFIRGLSWFPWTINTILCIVQGALTQFSEFASFMWVFIIAMCMFQIYVIGASEERMSNLMVWFQIGCWGLSIVIAVVPIYGNKYGRLEEDKNICWIRDTTDPERLLLYVPCILIFVVNCLAYLFITLRLRTDTSDIRGAIEKNMALYLLAFVFSQAPTVVLRAWLFFDQEEHEVMYVLLLLQSVFQPLQGLLDALVYGVNDPTFTTNYKRLAETCCSRHRGYTAIEEAKSEFFFDYEYTSNSNYSKTRQVIIAAESHPRITLINSSLN